MSRWGTSFLLFIVLLAILFFSEAQHLLAAQPRFHSPQKINLVKKMALTGQQMEQVLVRDSDPLQESMLETFSLQEEILKDPYYFNSRGELLPPPSSYISGKDLHIIISDAYNHRIVEVDRDKNIVWQYGHTGNPGTGPDYLHYPSFAESLGKGSYLVTDLGNDRVLRIDREGNILWQFGTTLFQGGGEEALYLAETASHLRDNNILITDTSNHRVIMVSPESRIVWQYGKGYRGTEAGELDSPQGSSEASEGNLLISDTGNHRVILVNRQKKILWQYGRTHEPGSHEGELNLPNMATELPNGNILVCDSGNHRIIEVSRKGRILWQYGKTGHEGSGFDELTWPYNAYRLENGSTLITDSDNNRIIEVDLYHRIVWQYGKTGIKGSGHDELDAPYDAHLIGDKEKNPLDPISLQGKLVQASRLEKLDRTWHEKEFTPSFQDLSVSGKVNEPAPQSLLAEQGESEGFFSLDPEIQPPDLGKEILTGAISQFSDLDQEAHLLAELFFSGNRLPKISFASLEGEGDTLADAISFYLPLFSVFIGSSALEESVMIGFHSRFEAEIDGVHTFYINPGQLVLAGIRLDQFQAFAGETDFVQLETEVHSSLF